MAVAIEREFGLFIGGEAAEPASGELRELVEPATGEPLARVAMAGEEDVDRAVEAARAALDGPWGKTPPNERSRLLHALADAIVANRKELAELESRNVGKAISSVKASSRRRRELPLLRLRDRARSRAARTRSAARCSSTR
jgi:acyl-CoA reductase-like NAD-dependent aldehyde dehydrogenase